MGSVLIFFIAGDRMKKFTFICVFSLIMTWMIKPVFGVEYGTDFLELGNPGGWSESKKTYDEVWTAQPNEIVYVDIWIKNLPEKLITAGFMITSDQSQVNILSADVYDGTDLTGPWDSDMTNKVAHPSGANAYTIIVGNLGSVSPDSGGDIPIARIKVGCNVSDNASMTIRPIDNFDTVVGNSSTVYDSEIDPHTVTIYNSQVTTTSTCPPDVICLRCPSEEIYGEYSKETELLRYFRDNVLKQTAEGRELIKLYYLWSPVIVKAMEQDEEFKEEVKQMIDAVLPMIEREVE
jgi:hypothetical protein